MCSGIWLHKGKYPPTAPARPAAGVLKDAAEVSVAMARLRGPAELESSSGGLSRVSRPGIRDEDAATLWVEAVPGPPRAGHLVLPLLK